MSSESRLYHNCQQAEWGMKQLQDILHSGVRGHYPPAQIISNLLEFCKDYNNAKLRIITLIQKEFEKESMSTGLHTGNYVKK